MVAIAAAIAALGWSAAWARRWTLFVPAAVALVLASSVVVAGVGALGLAMACVARRGRRQPLLCAATGVVGGIALSGMRDVLFVGGSALVAVAAAAPVVVSGYSMARPSVRSAMRNVAVGVGVLTATIIVLAGIALVGVRSDAERGVDAARRGVDAAEAGERQEAIAELTVASEALAAANDRLDVWWLAPGRVLPVLGPHLDAADELSATGAAVASSAADAAERADLDALRARSGRIDLDVVRSMQQPIASLVATLDRAQGSIAGIDSAWLIPQLRDEIDELALELDEQLGDAVLARDGLELLPAFLGADGQRRYLFLFGTTSEAREAGGLLGNFVEVIARDGAIRLGVAGRNSDLNNHPGEGRLRDPASYPDLYVAARPGVLSQDFTRVVDFPTLARGANELYSTMGGRPVDGVGYLDPSAIAALLRFIGSIEPAELGRVFTADNVGEFLLREQYESFDEQAERKDFLTDLSVDAFDRLLSIELPSPRALGEALAPAVRQGHLMFTAFDRDEAAFLAEAGVDGAFPSAAGGDLLSVVHVNKGSDKLDAYTYRSASYSVALTSTGGQDLPVPTWDVEATVEVRFRNGVVADGLPAYVIGRPDRETAPPGVNLAELSVYTPWELVEIAVDGTVAGDAASYAEFGAKRHVTTVAVGPGEERVITYRLRGTWEGELGDYALQLASQPLVHDAPLDVLVTANGVRLIDTTLILEEDVRLAAGGSSGAEQARAGSDPG